MKGIIGSTEIQGSRRRGAYCLHTIQKLVVRKACEYLWPRVAVGKAKVGGSDRDAGFHYFIDLPVLAVCETGIARTEFQETPGMFNGLHSVSM